MIRARHWKMASRFLAHRFAELHPYEVQASLLNACNLRCAYCKCPEVKIDLMTTEQWRDIIRRLGALGTLRIKWQGGEPTLRKDFTELCAATQHAGILTAVITNGIEIAARPALLDHVDEIVVSVDSPTADIHDHLRGAGTHAQAVRALDVARERGVRRFVVMVVHQENYHLLEATLAWCEARGAGMHAQPILFGRQYYDDAARRLALTAEQIRSMHTRLADWKRQGRGLMFSALAYQSVGEWPDYGALTTRSTGESSCMAGKFYIHIEANGDVLPCLQHGASLTPKNIVRDGFDAALRHAQHHDCGNCFTAYLRERKELFALRPAALLELARRG